MKTSRGGMDVRTHVFLTFALDGEWSASLSDHFTPGERTPVPMGCEARWAPEPVWTIWRNVNYCPYWDSNSYPSVVHRYTDCSQTLNCELVFGNICNTFMTIEIQICLIS
jgi:hypothetical protein